MRNLYHIVAILMYVASIQAQVQQYSFSTQAEYDQWNDVSSSAPFSFFYNGPGEEVLYEVATSDPEYLLSTQVRSTQLPFPVEGDFRITFKVRKLLPNSYNTYFPLLLTSDILLAPNEHPWRMGPTTPSSLGSFQDVPLLGVIFTHDQIGLIYRQYNASYPEINYIGNFELPSNTDLWVELIKTCSIGFALNVYDDPSMATVPLASQQFNLANIIVPLNALYIANCNGNGEWTEHSDLLDDYRVEIFEGTDLSFTYSIVPSTCYEPGTLFINAINGGVAPYQVSFNGQSTGNLDYQFEGEGTVAVTITDSEGCSKSSGIAVSTLGGSDQLVFPNVLTPNKDDVNDTWFVQGECIKSFECVIMDRWGNEIVTLDQINQVWDGTSNSKKCNDGVYFYKANVLFTSGERVDHQGFISLIR